MFTTFDIETVFRSWLLWRLSYEFGLKTLVRNLLAIILCLFIPCHCKYAFLREDLRCSCRHIACVLNHSNTFAAKVFRLCSTLAVLYIALEVFFLILDDFNTMLGIICWISWMQHEFDRCSLPWCINIGQQQLALRWLDLSRWGKVLSFASWV